MGYIRSPKTQLSFYTIIQNTFNFFFVKKITCCAETNVKLFKQLRCSQIKEDMISVFDTV